MTALLLALAVAPWTHPLVFHPAPGWQTGASGNTHSVYVGHQRPVKGALESAAWTAAGVRYSDPATADPPNVSLTHLSPNGVIVWAVAFSPTSPNEKPIRLDLARARRYACCEAVGTAGGEYELSGSGPGGAYSVIVRIYFGSKPTQALRKRAQHALDRLDLPPGR